MRVLHVLAARNPGGAEILVRDMALEFRRREHHVGIAFISRVTDLGGSPTFEAHYQETLEAASIETFDMGHACRRNPILGAFRLNQVIREFRPDILHIHLQYGLLFRLLLWPRRVPTTYTHHIDRFRKGKTVFRLLSLAVDRFVAISRQTEKLLRSAVGDCVTRIVNAVRPSVPLAPPVGDRPAGHFQILSVGALYAQKDYSTLVRTAARILADRPDLRGRVRFLIAGQGPERAQLEAQISAAGLEPTVVLLGARTDVPDLMAQSDFLLMTSSYEGLPITLIEALHAGLPIVATDVGGVSEVVDDGINGLLASAGDADGLAAHVLTLIDNPALLSQFGAASRAKSTQFSIEVCVERLLQMYHDVIASSMGGN